MRRVLKLAVLAGTVACAPDANKAAESDARSYDTSLAYSYSDSTVICSGEVSDHPGCERNSSLRVLDVREDGAVLLGGKPGEAVAVVSANESQVVVEVGRVGQGPGEYSYPLAGELSPNGITVFELTRRALISYTSDGKLATETILSGPSMRLMRIAIHEGKLFTLEQLDSAPSSEGIVLGTLVYSGDAIDTVARHDARVAGVDANGLIFRHHFSPSPQWARLPDGTLVFTDARDPIISLLPPGNQPSSVTLPIRLEPVTEEQKANAPQFYAFRKAPNGAGFETESPTAPATHPAFSGIVAALDGSFWIREAVIPKRDSIRWNHLDSNGMILGHIVLPATQHVASSDQERGVLILNDSRDSIPNRLVWYRLRHQEPR